MPKFIYIFLLLLIGFIIGIVSSILYYRFKKKYSGILIIDRSDQDKTQWTLKCNKSQDDIVKKNDILFKIELKK